MESETTKLTVRLPKRHVAFAKAYAKSHGITVTEVIARYLRRMQALEQRVPAPELQGISDLVPQDVDAEAAFQQHLLEKHGA